VVTAVAVAEPVFGRTRGVNCVVGRTGETTTLTRCAGESLLPLSLFVTVHVIGIGVVVPLHAPPVAEVEGDGHAEAVTAPAMPMKPRTASTAPRMSRIRLLNM
jgi:hypothetical protein